MKRRTVAAFSLTLAAVLGACGGAIADADSAPDEATGVARLALSGVPGDVACVHVVVTGATRTVERRLDAAAGATGAAALDGLPTGPVLVTGDAFAVACTAVDGATPTWTAAPVSATLASDSVPDITLVFARDGRAMVNVAFDAGTD